MRVLTVILAIVCLTAAPLMARGSSAPVQAKPSPATSAKTTAPVVTGRANLALTIPSMLSYQGKLTDTLGAPVADTTYSVTFKLYTVASGGTAFWTEVQTVRTKKGLFSVLLGSVTAIDSVPQAGTCYLGMQVATGTELTPRLRIVSSAYSFAAKSAASAALLEGKDTTALWNAKTLEGKDTTGFVRTGQANSVTSAMIVDSTITAADLNRMGAAAGQVLKWNGSAWAPSNDSIGGGSGSGTVTKVTQASGIVCTPNPITDSGTVRFDSTWGDSRYVNEGQAAGGDLTGTYPSPALSSSGVTAGTYGDSAHVGKVTVDAKGRVTSASSVVISGVPPSGAAGGDLTGTYPNPTIATGAVTSAKILDATIAAADLATTGVTAGTYGSATQVSQVTVNTKGQVTGAANVTITGVPPGGAAGGDLTGTYPNPTVATGAVTSAKILDGTIAAADIGTGAVTSSGILDGTIAAADIATTGVTAGTYGSATQVSQVTVNNKGQVTAAANVTITGVPPDSAPLTATKIWVGNGNNKAAAVAMSGDAALSNAGALALAASGVTAGTYGDSAHVGKFTVDAKGRLTSASSVVITGVPPGGAAGGDLTGTYPNPTLHLPYSGNVASSSVAAFSVKNTATSNDSAAILGRHDTTDFYGAGIEGIGGHYGVEGLCSPTGSSTYYGTYGQANGGSGTNYGLYGTASGSGTKYGVYGQASGTAVNYGVYGTASGGSTNKAGFFVGDVTVTGNLSKGGGSFQIDHPLDPLNKYLYHSFVESPDMMDIYNGNVKTDASGYATVTLPNWFEALNRDFRYQLTVIDEGDGNGFAQAKVARGVKDNSFVIRTSVPLTTVSWQVTGIRQDPYANQHRIQVEVDKPAGERGKYLHPDAYGQPREAGIGVPPEDPKSVLHGK